MPPAELSGPDLDGVVADANAVAHAIELDRAGEPARFASLRSLVGSSASRDAARIASISKTWRVNGELPIDPIPGLDS